VSFKCLILRDEKVVQTSAYDDVVAAHRDGLKFWVELDEKTEQTERLLGEVLKIHPLAVEDVWNDIGIPKVEDFVEYVLLVMHGIHEEAKTA
jgi:Mg2+ and Co2+ transporter CorA